MDKQQTEQALSIAVEIIEQFFEDNIPISKTYQWASEFLADLESITKNNELSLGIWTGTLHQSLGIPLPPAKN